MFNFKKILYLSVLPLLTITSVCTATTYYNCLAKNFHVSAPTFPDGSKFCVWTITFGGVSPVGTYPAQSVLSSNIPFSLPNPKKVPYSQANCAPTSNFDAGDMQYDGFSVLCRFTAKNNRSWPGIITYDAPGGQLQQYINGSWQNIDSVDCPVDSIYCRVAVN